MSDTIDEAGGSVATLTKKDFTSDQEVRWCPGLRRLRDPLRGPRVHARARHRPAQDRVRERDRMQRPLHVLHGHLRGARDPRPCAGDRDRHRDREPRPERVGRDGRRRRALDRRQPSDPRPPTEREHQDPDVQQPDLRPHEGAVLADQRGGQGHEVHAVRLGRPPLQPDRGGARRRGHLRRPNDRQRPPAPHGGPAPGGRPPGHGVRRDLSELQRVQRRGVRPAAREVRGRPPPDPPRGRAAHHLRRGTQVRDRRRQRTAAGRVRPTRSTRTGSSCTKPAGVRPCRSASRICRSARTRQPASACSAISSGPCTARRCTQQLDRATERLGKGDLEKLLHGGDTWTVG